MSDVDSYIMNKVRASQPRRRAHVRVHQFVRMNSKGRSVEGTGFTFLDTP